jgi:hypothetical protein
MLGCSELTEVWNLVWSEKVIRYRFRKLLLMLVASALAVLPLHFAFATVSHTSVELTNDHIQHKNTFDHTEIDDCWNTSNAHAGGGCKTTSSCDFADQCCDDNCSSAQPLMTQLLTFHVTTATTFALVLKQQLPDPIFTDEFRPPIYLY